VSAPARFTQADLKRAAAGVRAAGLPVARVEVDREGRIAVIVGQPANDMGEEFDAEDA
jgi:hypothetical protein